MILRALALIYGGLALALLLLQTPLHAAVHPGFFLSRPVASWQSQRAYPKMPMPARYQRLFRTQA